MPTNQISEEDRFKFEMESKVLGRVIEGFTVNQNVVQLHLSGESAVMFSVDGDHIIISVPGEPSLTLDTDGVVQ